jgi:hypothetical protein
MRLNIYRITLKFVIFIFLILVNTNAYSEKLKVYYSGFSFSNTYESNKEYSKYSSLLIKEINPKTKINIISSELNESIGKSNFRNISLISDQLIDLDKLENGSVVMAVALQHEEFSQEYNYSSQVYNGFYDCYFEILFYDFDTKNLIASLPFDFEISMLSEKKFTQNEILKRIKDFYLEDRPFNRIENIINNFDLKRKYNLRIGITNVEIDDRAFNDMPLNSKKYLNATKNLLAQTFSKRFSYIHNISMVPYTEGQVIGNAMKLRFIQSNEIYSLKLPNPDFHINLRLKGFKKVLAKSSPSENLYVYGSFFDIKIHQPEIDQVYFDEALRGVTKVKIPINQSEINHWRKYFYNIEKLFNDFSQNIIKQDPNWLKKTSKKKIKKDLKVLKKVINKVK